MATLPFAPMQLLPKYHAKLDPKFLTWYQREFRNERRAYAHWSAGRREIYPEYHICVSEDEHGVATVTHNAPVSQDLYEHTYGRNTNAFAISFMGLFHASPDNLGDYPPTPAMVDAFVDVCAQAMVNERIPVGNIQSHDEAGDNMDFPNRQESYSLSDNPETADRMAQALGFPHAGYGHRTTCDRWDLYCSIDPTTRIVYPIHNGPAGSDDLADYLRGAIALKMQELTRAKWDPSATTPFGKGATVR